MQIGDKDNMSALTEDGQLAKKILDEYYLGFQERNPNLRVFSAHLHMDEATPHIHIDFVPFTTGSKRGLDTRVSLKQVLATQGFKGGTRGNTEWNQWVQAEKERLAEIMLYHGIERERKGTHEKHLSVLGFQKKQRAEEVELLAAEKVSIEKDVKKAEAKLDETLPKLKNAEKLAADYPDDVELLLPEPSAFETAKSYREKKATPALDKAVRLVKSLYHTLLDLQGKYGRLKAECDRKDDRYSRIWESNQKLIKENTMLRESSRKLERIETALGKDAISALLSHLHEHIRSDQI